MDDPDRPTKRTKLSNTTDSSLPGTNNDDNHHVPLASLHRSITPPSLSRATHHNNVFPPQPQPNNNINLNFNTNTNNKKEKKILPSPIQLTHIRDLPTTHNTSTLRLRDILSSPLIRECWQFNYLFDVDFLMNQFDEDVRHLVKVKVVHGSWKKEADNRVRIDEACTRYPNVEAITAYMPEPFGTHHSKMMVLVRWDDVVEVVIHTANMIPGDWTNMTQAVWRSPLLPLSTSPRGQGDVGPGGKFKRDLLSYLRAYGPKKTGSLVEQLEKYDFGAVRAALVASVPSKVKMGGYDEIKTWWGWLGLRDVLRSVPVSPSSTEGDKKKGGPHIVTQISSIATLGQTSKWLNDVFFTSLAPSSQAPDTPRSKPTFSIIFPTPDEMRRSLNGYGSGGSIHMKLQSAAQQKQLQYLRPYLCRWAGDENTDRDAGRRRAAPHVKTYIRYATEEMDRIDWAMVTSANLSTQAWGAAVNGNGEVRVCSWEIGVVVWPELLGAEGSEDAKGSGNTVMIPCFRTDTPDAAAAAAVDADTVIGFRMPYDLPLTRYTADDIPWCATASHSEPDWLGQTWED
ncbi:putative tyrosyl-DNA phosphodiesterase [Aspergillus sclerotioniger CBS 115572]|uniref:Putative tyrosyl-DNA phosphodiesterase n=1 Tax=Aspergillus sclerotioniger CBS 115572 TaxID=1450535 RepID=A0A317WKG0_9EURO|nr:putative tyrosyl-DNA phosphodiesterase [Aspergillus sclerotioniger CBS 115572]PWY84680.1 putative tyrosyl-DNA phosphodiesterase [Aspergillus sclerotioniger CBS 115572]